MCILVWAAKKLFLWIMHILVRVTKTYCFLLGGIPFKMCLEYWTLLKIFMYIKDEFLKFMNTVFQKYRIQNGMYCDKGLYVINAGFFGVEV